MPETGNKHAELFQAILPLTHYVANTTQTRFWSGVRKRDNPLCNKAIVDLSSFHEVDNQPVERDWAFPAYYSVLLA